MTRRVPNSGRDQATAGHDCFVEVLDSEALHQDDAPDALNAPGLLDGLAVAVKDIIGVAGTTMRAGSLAYARSTEEDATAVALLRAHGARVVGTTRTQELALGPTGLNPHDLDGGLKNPYDVSRIAGGSSTGSAVAVARGACPLALGTDTGGSVRIPAALCGVVGFKPSYGLVPLHGVLPAAPTLDHVGILGGDLADVARAAEALGCQPPMTPKHDVERGPESVHIGVLGTESEIIDPEVATVVDDAVRIVADRGVYTEPVTFRSSHLLMEMSSTILLYEASRFHADLLRERGDELTPLIRSRLEFGATITAVEYRRALRGRQAVIRELAELFEHVDVVISPTVPILAPTIHEAEAAGTISKLVHHTRLANIAGNPAVSIPLRGTSLPVGLQVAAARHDDWTALRVAAFVQESLA